MRVEKANNLDDTKEWKDIKDYEGNYKISEYGDVYSMVTGQMLKPTINLSGYYTVKLIKDKKIKCYAIHRLVYNTFKGLTDDDLVIDHIDKNRTNNHIDNLREVTKSENSINSDCSTKNMNKINQYSIWEKLIREWNSLQEIVAELKYKSSDNIESCYLGKTKTAYGFIWKNMSIAEDLSGYHNIVTDDGNTYSNYKIDKSGNIIKNNTKCLLKPCINSGYYCVGLMSNNRIKKQFKVHRLVATTFIPNPNNYPIVNHKDENKLNNKVNNLEWCDHKKNVTHSCGKKINQIDSKTNEIIKTFNSISNANRELNKKSNDSAIVSACKSRMKTAYGYKWQYA